MAKSKNNRTQTRPSIQYKPKSRGSFEHQSTIYRPVKQNTQEILKPSPHSCFYSRIMTMINKLK